MAKRKNANGEGNICKRERNGQVFYEGRLPVGHHPNGQIKFRYFSGKTKTEVRKKMIAARAEIDAGKYIEPQKYTIAKWMDEWHEHYLSNVKPMTREQYAYQIRVHIKPAIGRIKLQALTRDQVQRFYNGLYEPHTVECEAKDGSIQKLEVKGLSAKSVKNLHGVLHKAMQKAYELDMIPKNPCDFIELQKAVKKEMHTVAEDKDLKAFLQAIAGNPYEAIFKVTVFSGIRESEAIGLTWDCINMETGQMRIYRQLQKPRERGSAYRFVPLKNGKERTFIVPPYVLEVLRQVRIKQNEDRLKAGPAWSNPEGFVFTNELGGHLSNYTIYHHLKACAAKAGNPDLRFHDLRHTYATMRLEGGDDIKQVSAALGHATTAFTMDQYAHVTDKMQRDSANRLQAKIDAL